MNKGILVGFLVLVLGLVLSAQERYSVALFDEIRVETATYATKDGQNLDMDIYLPENDSEPERATILYVHGGGFSKGSRGQQNIREFCRHLAGYGYVVASMSYRLTRQGEPTGFGCDCPVADKLNTIHAAVEDVQDATFYLIQSRYEYNIDPYKIILAGSSAGAETVLTAAYTPPNCYGLDGGPVAYAGVIGMAGAVVDTSAIYDESAIPSLLFHGTDDPLVPYGSAPHHYCEKGKPGYLIMHGSQTIADKLHRLGVPCWLHTSCGAGHELHSRPFTDYFDVIVEFCNTFVMKGEEDWRQTVVPGVQDTTKFPVYEFCEQ